MLQIAICDEDRKAQGQLCLLVKKVLDKYSIRYSLIVFDSGEELLASSLLFHFIFLGIKFSGEDGIEIGRKIYQRNNSIKIIFQTKLGEYCGDAINKSHAFGFLEKPVDELVLEGQIRDILQSQENVQELWMEFRNVRCLQTQEEKEIIKIPIKSIVLFEYQKSERTVKVVTERGEFVCSETMNRLEEKMSPFGFEVCSRGLLVNLDKIKQIRRQSVILCNNSVLPLSQRRTVYFKERMCEFGHSSFPTGNNGGIGFGN